MDFKLHNLVILRDKKMFMLIRNNFDGDRTINNKTNAFPIVNLTSLPGMRWPK